MFKFLFGRGEKEAQRVFEQAGEAFDRGDNAQALNYYLEVIRISPNSAKAHVMAGFLYEQKNNLQDARRHLLAALELDSANADACFILATMAAKQGNRKEMADHFQSLLKLDPLHELAYAESAKYLFEQKQLDEGIALLERGLRYLPNSVTLHQSFGNFLYANKQHFAAYDAYLKALKLGSQDHGLLYNLAISCAILGRQEQALNYLEQILENNPQHVLAHLERGVLLLQLGRYLEAWSEFDWRWKTSSLAAVRFSSNRPRWDGSQDLKGKTIVILSEQGYGDTIQFCRFIPVLAKHGARVIFVVLRPLYELMTQVPGVDRLLTELDPLPEYDFYCELMSLPGALACTLEMVASSKITLQAPVETVANWSVRLGKAERMRIAYVWSGNSSHATNSYRSISLHEAKSVFACEADFVVPAKIENDDDREVLGAYGNVSYCGDELQSFSDTAALIELSDVVVTVDTSVAHLAGAMGKRCIVLLSYHPDWRWLLDRRDSPWYPSIELVRQKHEQSWTEVLSSVFRDQLQLEMP